MEIKPIKNGVFEKTIDKRRYFYNFVEGQNIEVADFLVIEIKEKGFLSDKKNKIKNKGE